MLTITGGGSEVTADKLIEELRQLYRLPSESMEVTEWASGMPKFPPGRYRQISEFQQRDRRPGLSFCGDYLLGPFIEGAVTTALRAVETIRP
jgi:hypothetical protein